MANTYPVDRVISVYHRYDNGQLGRVNASITDEQTHADAILEVCEFLVSTGVGYNKPVLAVIKGGKV